MSEFTKRAVLFCIGVGIVLFGAWLAGMEFERGGNLVFVYLMALVAGVFLAGYPGIEGDA